jgi:hypothetical protein
MSQRAAKIILDVAIKNATEQDAALIEIQSLCTEDEFKEYRGMIGRSMGVMLFEIIYPIIAKYPELKPSQMK